MLELSPGKIKDYEIGICCFPAKHAVVRSKSKDRLVCSSGATCLPVDCCISRLVCSSGATCLPVDCCISELEL